MIWQLYFPLIVEWFIFSGLDKGKLGSKCLTCSHLSQKKILYRSSTPGISQVYRFQFPEIVKFEVLVRKQTNRQIKTPDLIINQMGKILSEAVRKKKLVFLFFSLS